MRYETYRGSMRVSLRSCITMEERFELKTIGYFNGIPRHWLSLSVTMTTCPSDTERMFSFSVSYKKLSLKGRLSWMNSRPE